MVRAACLPFRSLFPLPRRPLPWPASDAAPLRAHEVWHARAVHGAADRPFPPEMSLKRDINARSAPLGGCRHPSGTAAAPHRVTSGRSAGRSRPGIRSSARDRLTILPGCSLARACPVQGVVWPARQDRMIRPPSAMAVAPGQPAARRSRPPPEGQCARDVRGPQWSRGTLARSVPETRPGDRAVSRRRDGFPGVFVTPLQLAGDKVTATGKEDR